jgi:hypothetical protein
MGDVGVFECVDLRVRGRVVDEGVTVNHHGASSHGVPALADELAREPWERGRVTRGLDRSGATAGNAIRYGRLVSTQDRARRLCPEEARTASCS